MAAPTSNSAWGIPENSSSVTQLVKQTLPIPTPGPHQVLVKLTAASLNYRDLLITTNSPSYPGTNKPNLVPCVDGAGIIHSTHPSSSWAGKQGTRVILHPNTWLSGDVRNLTMGEVFGGGQVDGTLRNWIVVDDKRVVAAPKNLTNVESTTLVTAGGTAWSAIRGWIDAGLDGEVRAWDRQRRLEGKTVLTLGTGGVSCFAIQIASALGATVIATSSSDAKLELAKSFGATHVINYKKTPDWDKEVLRITDGKGVDHTLEVSGAQTLMRSLSSTRRGGLISLIGVLSETDRLPVEFVPSLMFSGKILKGCVGFSRDSTAELAEFVEEHGIKPVVGKVFGFDQAVEAFEALQQQNIVGKVVIKITDE